MAHCEVKKGIFIIQPCNEFAGVVCANCGIHICADHAKQNGPGVYCPECAVKSEKEHAQKLGNKHYRRWEEGLSSNYSSWYYSLRSNFYAYSMYTPFRSTDYDGFERYSDNDFKDETDAGNYMES